jgi:hypothetical protein
MLLGEAKNSTSWAVLPLVLGNQTNNIPDQYTLLNKDKHSFTHDIVNDMFICSLIVAVGRFRGADGRSAGDSRCQDA